MELSEILRALDALPESEQERLMQESVSMTQTMRWIPNEGPQTQAYNSQADMLLYGGAAGGGKSQLLLGLATQEQTRTIIFRREGTQADGLIAEAKMLLGDCYNGQEHEFKWDKTRSLKFAGLKEEDDWRSHAGRERDGIFFDEAGEFLQSQVQSSLGWNRGPMGQRCRIVLASNPPRDTTGLWMLEFFAPWLDPAYTNPAKPGELRWCYMSDDDRTVWVDGSEPIPQPGKDRPIYPHSRTFIPAKLKDNPYRNNVEYISRLQATPGASLRKQLLDGDFLIGQTPRAYQLIPSDWVREAQARWKSTPPPGVPMCAMGIDVAQGGLDENVMACRFDGWYDVLTILPGSATPLGTDSAGWIITKRRDNAIVVIDCGGGYGAVAYTTLNDNGIAVHPYKGAEKSLRKTKENLFGFANKRSELYWKFREALDPAQPGGSQIFLPPDPILLADLTAPDYKMVGRNYSITTKEQLVKDLGRSTDRGDAVVMAWSQGAKAITDLEQWGSEYRNNKLMRQPRVIVGHPEVKRFSQRPH